MNPKKTWWSNHHASTNKTQTMHKRTVIISIFLILSILPSIHMWGQNDTPIDLNLLINSAFTIHNYTNILSFPPCPPDTVMVTENPFLITVETNTMGVYLTFQCVSPQGDLVRSLIKQEFLDTWYIITDEIEPPPEEDDPRWILGKQMIGYIYPIMSTGSTEVRIFSKVRSEFAENGLYRDQWTITASDGEQESSIPMTVDCEVAE